MTRWNIGSHGTFGGFQFDDIGGAGFGRRDYSHLLARAGTNRQRLMDTRTAIQRWRNTPAGQAAVSPIPDTGANAGSIHGLISSDHQWDPSQTQINPAGTTGFTMDDYRHALASGRTHRQVRDWLSTNPSNITGNVLMDAQTNADRVARERADAQQQSAMSDIAAQRDQFSSQAAALERNLGTTTSQLNTAQTNLADVTGQLDLATSQLGTTRGNLSSTQRALTTSQQQRDALRTQLRGALDASTRITRAAPQRVSGATSATGIAPPRTTRSGGFRGTLAGLTRSAPATGPNQLRINTLNI